jgi:hypothetical protein
MYARPGSREARVAGNWDFEDLDGNLVLGPNNAWWTSLFQGTKVVIAVGKPLEYCLMRRLLNSN